MKTFIKKTIVAVLLLTASVNLLFAQEDLQGGQFIFDKTFINPAFSGLDNKLETDLHYQMLGGGQATNNAYVISAGANIQLEKAKSGMGINVIRSTFGNDNYTVGYINYAYHLKVSEQTMLSSSLSLGIQQYDIDLSGAITSENNDPLAQSSVYNSRLNGRFGFLASIEKKYYFGASFDNIFSQYKNRDDFDNATPSAYRRISMYLLAGVNMQYDSGVVFNPSVLYISNFGGISYADLNLMLTLNNTVSFGLGFRQSLENSRSAEANSNNLKNFSRSLIRPMFQYQLNGKKDNLKIGYCYNFNANRDVAIGHSSHDISLVFSLPLSPEAL
ncbi:MAG TPA: PorP/SprF family type IX secretion system membrane protein [Pelobium sp.]|nr:PorP/SprF family type IX secretion system membrane protein [Pelobium sp.]